MRINVGVLINGVLAEKLAEIDKEIKGGGKNEMENVGVELHN